MARWLADQAGVDRASAQCGAVTLIQRFGSALNLTNSLQANLCAKREVARAADAIGARQTSSYGRGVDCGHRSLEEKRRSMSLSTAPQTRVTPGILPSALRASLSAVPNRSRRFGQHRREHVRPLWRHATHRRQHRKTHRHPRHPRPLRKARRAGKSALPTRPARTARSSRVTPRRPRRRRRNQARPHGAATTPQGSARPAVGNRREMATSGAAARPRDAEIPLTNIRSAPKLALARPPPTRQTV